MASPISLSPKSCIVNDRSSPSPASAVPLTSFEINSSRNGRRSTPLNAIVVSLAKPILSAWRTRDAASVLSMFTSDLHKIQTVHMRQQPLDLRDDCADVTEFALQIVARGILIQRPRLGNEARACANAKRRDRMLAAAQCDRLTDEANFRCDLLVARACVRRNAILRIPGQRAIDLPATLQRQSTIIARDHKWKDRPLSQFLIVDPTSIRPPLRRQQAKRWREI